MQEVWNKYEVNAKQNKKTNEKDKDEKSKHETDIKNIKMSSKQTWNIHASLCIIIIVLSLAHSGH